MPRRTASSYCCHHFLLIAAATLLAMSMARAADPLSYTVTIASTGNRELDRALKGSSQLESLRAKEAISPFALIGRAQQDIERLETVLQGFGYYQGKVAITIERRPLDDPGLPAAMEALPEGTNAAVDVAIDTGPLYHLRKVTIEGEIPPWPRRYCKRRPDF